MSRMVGNIRISILFTCVLLGTAGCIKEDNSNCTQDLYVRFTTENPKHYLPELFRIADLYFYDETGVLYTRLTYERKDLTDRGLRIPDGIIREGKYTLVSVINDIDDYETSGGQLFGSLQTSLKWDVSSDKLVDLFSGVTQVKITGDQSPREIDVDIFKHNNDIHLEVMFENYEVPQGSVLESYVGGNNGVYDYKDGTSPESCYREYLPYRQAVGPDGGASFYFSVMRLWRNSDLTLFLQETDGAREVKGSVELDIAGELAKVVNEDGEFLFDTDEKLSFHDEFKIVVKLRSDLSILELTINGWYVIGGGVDV